jgi:hypothetical protein
MSTGTVPPMPINPEPATANDIYLTIMVAVFAGMLIWWFFSNDRKTIGPALPLLLVGGLLSAMAEPFLDNAVLFWYPPHPDLPSVAAYGRDLPIWVPLGYAWFCGGLAYFVGRQFHRGVTRRQVWAIAGGVALVDFLAIGATSWLNVAGFYGDPPLDVAGYPLWWSPFDVSIALLGGTLVMHLLPRLQGRQRWYYVAVAPVAVGGACGIVSWPIATALNSSWSSEAKLIAAVMTIGIGLLVINTVAAFVSTRASKPAGVAALQPRHDTDLPGASAVTTASRPSLRTAR